MYRHNKKLIRIALIFSAIFALILTPYLLSSKGAGFVNSLKVGGFKIIELTLKPSVYIKNKIGSTYWSLTSIFADKKNLAEENYFLKNEVLRLQARLEQDELFRKEYFDLVEKLGRNPPAGGEELLMARVITTFTELPYDTILLDMGRNDGIKEGMMITAYDGSLFIGVVREIASNFSRGVLISSLNEETNVVFDKAKVSAIANGIGNKELSIILPRDLDIEIGERVYTLSENPLLVGFVERIEKKTVDPLQKIIVRLPFNIQELHSVFLTP